jgi:hypothetical protein
MAPANRGNVPSRRSTVSSAPAQAEQLAGLFDAEQGWELRESQTALWSSHSFPSMVGQLTI